ncbi:MAG: pyruvate kinase alpha/beta domain-containing protein [Candidatus Bipolaricaulota bacterium]
MIALAAARAQESQINTVLVASTTGATALAVLQAVKGKRIVSVTQHSGYDEPDSLQWPEQALRAFEAGGGTRFTGSHAFFGVARAVRQKWGTYLLEEIVASTLRLFGEGMKVCCEISMMAADAGLIRTDEEVLVIAGSGRGADTAVVTVPVNLSRFFELRIREILCMPRPAAEDAR